MNFFNNFPMEQFRAALSVANIHPKERLHDRVKDAAGELATAGLRLVKDSAFDPT